MPQKSSLPDAPWSKSAQKILEYFDVVPEKGLRSSEVEELRSRHGRNRLREKKETPTWKIFISQFTDPIVGLLGIASILAFLFGKWVEGMAIAAALFINAIIGFVTELKAARSMEALQKLGQVEAGVRRDGQVQTIGAEELVPGDIVIIEAGDLISADLRLIEANNIQVDEAALTGESTTVSKKEDPVDEDAPLAERASMLFKGTAISSGSGEGIVTATGMETELGTIADLTQEAEDESTPLEKRLNRLGKRLIWVTLAMGLLVAVAGFIGGKPWLLVVETAIAMAVAAVPEGLPIVATIALARGMWRMARRNAVINRLSAVETLGATTVICADKTGTLTANRMSVKRLLLADETDISVGQEDSPAFQTREGEEIPEDEALLERAIKIGVWCNNAELNNKEDNGGAVGDPMEVALLNLGHLYGLKRPELLEKCPEEREVAFSTETKKMATYHRCGDGLQVAVKGAAEEVLAVCSKIAGREGEQDLSSESRDAWLDRNRQLAEEGLRVLALAGKIVDHEEAEPYENLAFHGLVGMWDPPRESAAKAISACHDAGIRVVMVTGDHPITARVVACEVGLCEDDEPEVMEGKVLEEIDQAEKSHLDKLRGSSIFARVSPEQKLSLIKLHQDHDAIVAMTGDGVNDAPALKKADIGVAMGQRGTQVAKEAADMVLQDDDFATIVTAVQYGRVIFGNIRKFIYFLLSGNISEILIITLAAVVGAPLPLLPLQILYLNLIGDVFPALALGVGEGDPGIMKKPPRDPQEPVLTRDHWIGIGGYSIVITVAVLAAFAIALEVMKLDQEKAVTVSFMTLALARLWHVFNMRDAQSPLILNEITRNPFIWGALGICIALLMGGLLMPGLSNILGLVLPGFDAILLMVGMSFVPLIVGQAFKVVVAARKSSSPEKDI